MEKNIVIGVTGGIAAYKSLELVSLLKKRGFNILEMPVKWINSPDSKVNPIFDSLQMLFDLVKIRLRI